MAVRAPVFFGNSLALHIETRQKLTAQQARERLKQAPGLELLDEAGYPSVVSEAADEDAVFVGRVRRVRESTSHPCGLDLWVVADNMPRARC